VTRKNLAGNASVVFDCHCHFHPKQKSETNIMENMQSAIAVDPGLVRAKAYELWQSLGCPDGAAEQTWLEAERQLLAARADVARESVAATSAAKPVELESSPTASRPASDSVVPPSNRTNSKAKKRSVRR
jgi:hypothetical protein